MKNFRFLLLAIFSLNILFVACSDDEDDNDEPAQTNQTNNNNNNTNSTPDPSLKLSDADASLIAIMTESQPSGSPIAITLGTAVATFYDANKNLVEAGSVTLEGETLDKQTNNSYVSVPEMTNPTGISFTQPLDWSVSGSSSFAGFNESRAQDFPSVDAISSASTVDKSDGYTLSTNSISGADSTIFQVGDVLITQPGSVTSYSFSSGELSALGNGPSVAQIASYKITSNTHNSKKVYFITETVKSITVTVQD